MSASGRMLGQCRVPAADFVEGSFRCAAETPATQVFHTDTVENAPHSQILLPLIMPDGRLMIMLVLAPMAARLPLHFGHR